MRQLLKRLLSVKRREKIKAKLQAFDLWILPFFVKKPWLASFYYCFINRTFAREHFSVLQGRISYYKSLKSVESSSTLLRRNIHRLEKGLIMRPLRSVFAESYIAETVERFVICNNADALNKGEYKWATDVLTKYFSLVTETKVIAVAHKYFLKSMREINHNQCTHSINNESIPYKYSEIRSSNIEFEQFKQLCTQRRSVRWYQEKIVPRTLIEKALTAATLAPSACNRQPFEYFVFDKPEHAQKIGDLAMGTVGFSHNFQCLLVVVGDLAAYPFERDRHVIYIDGSLASMQLMLAFETLGLSSCVINWPDVEVLEKKIANKLKLTSNQRPLMLISVGYADKEGMIPFSDKKTPKELIKEVEL